MRRYPQALCIVSFATGCFTTAIMVMAIIIGVFEP